PFGGPALLRSGTIDGTSDKGDGAALRHGIHRIENQVDQSFPEFAGITQQRRQLGFQFALDLDGNALALRKVAPARPGEFDYFFDNLIDIQREQRFRIRATPIELPHAGDDLSYVPTRLVDGLQVMP